MSFFGIGKGEDEDRRQPGMYPTLTPPYAWLSQAPKTHLGVPTVENPSPLHEADETFRFYADYGSKSSHSSSCKARRRQASSFPAMSPPVANVFMLLLRWPASRRKQYAQTPSFHDLPIPSLRACLTELLNHCSTETHGGGYPAGGGFQHDDDDDFRNAAEHASRHAGNSGDSDFFGNILGSLGNKQHKLAEEDLDEECERPHK